LATDRYDEQRAAPLARIKGTTLRRALSVDGFLPRRPHPAASGVALGFDRLVMLAAASGSIWWLDAAFG